MTSDRAARWVYVRAVAGRRRLSAVADRALARLAEAGSPPPARTFEESVYRIGTPAPLSAEQLAAIDEAAARAGRHAHV